MNDTTRNVYARRFRRAADRFRAFPPDGVDVHMERGRGADGAPCNVIVGTESAEKLKTDCGNWLLRVYRLGFAPPELAELLAHHATPDNSPLRPGEHVRRVRGAYNLFTDVCAGGVVLVRTEGARLVPVGETGGVLEALAPGGVALDKRERCAEGCELLADLIENHKPAAEPIAPPAAEPVSAPEVPAEPPAALLDAAKSEEQRRLLQKLWRRGQVPVRELWAKPIHSTVNSQVTRTNKALEGFVLEGLSYRIEYRNLRSGKGKGLELWAYPVVAQRCATKGAPLNADTSA